jgi:plasmid stabilization system protein ParE
LLREALWYDRQRPRLGDELLDEITRAIALLKQFPESAPAIGGDYRRLLIRRFPFGMIYRIDGDEIIIVAVAHSSRKPNYWSKRLRRDD